MNNFKKIICAAALLTTSAACLASCNDPVEVQTFGFTASLNSGSSVMEIGVPDSVKIETNGVDDQNRNYQYEARTNTISVDENGGLEALATGKAVVKITETVSGDTFLLEFTVNSTSTPAKGGFNFSNAKDIKTRTEILARLEKYAIDSHLTGITLFENGGYVKYSKRTVIPASEYITGYGWGLLSEGSLDGVLSGDQNGPYKDYYHTSQTNNTYDINAYNASGSQISDLFGYISSSYWSTKMNANKNGYVWYPCLAADTVTIDGKTIENTRPIPAQEENALGLYRKWRIYVKTDANNGAKGLKFRTKNATFDNTPVTLADYEFAYRMLLTGSSKLSRGAEMAADKTYGIKGAQSYYNRTKTSSDAAALATWNSMKADGSLGFKTSADVAGYTGPEYVELELVNDIDSFTAMYTLSSNLVSPMSEAFIKAIGKDGTIPSGVAAFGKEGDEADSIPNYTIGVGTYFLEVWDKDNVCFKRNDDWFEVSDKRYLIPGIMIHNYDGASQDSLYEYFQKGNLDSCGIPIKQIDHEMGNVDEMGKTLKTEGDSTFKLNVNSCTQERWDELFGSEGKIAQNSKIDTEWGGIKPWMSNDAFLNGLYWSIDRETFAKNRGVNPSINYFSNTYLSDPEAGISYNSTPEHKNAISKYHAQVPYKDPVTDEEGFKDNYGYNYSKAVNYFKTAVNQLKRTGDIIEGTPDNPEVINIHIRWMYSTDITDYGNEIAGYFEKAFNDPSVSGGKVKLVVKQNTVSYWEDVYNKFMMVGQFDLAFGAISGNTYNPLNFLEVLKSDNSSTFTLNWGPDTSKIDTKNPIVYDGKKWSFDGLWECSDRGGIVEDGSIIKTVKNRYVIDEFGDFEANESTTFTSKLDFATGEGIAITLDKVAIYSVVDGTTYELDKSKGEYSYDEANGILTITVKKALATQIADDMRRVLNRTDSAHPVNPGDTGYIADPFRRKNYYNYFTFDISYSLSINGGNPTQSQTSLVIAQEDQDK